MGIKIVEKPSVYLVGESALSWKAPGYDEFLRDNQCPEWDTDTLVNGQVLVEVAGRLCYQSFKNPRPGGNSGYIKHILEVGHGSVLEHATFSMIFAGVSRSLTHELVRHRAGMSYSQESQRYIDESDVAFVVPPAILAKKKRDGTYTLMDVWESSCRESLDAYRSLVENLEDPGIADKTARRKAARESARSVLPNCTETRIFVTGNGRSWRNFLEQRGALGADAEIRRLALAVLPVLDEASPAIFGDYRVETTGGIDHIATLYRKV